MFPKVLIALFCVLLTLSPMVQGLETAENDWKFMMNLNETGCGPNYELLFEVKPMLITNDVCGILHVSDALAVYFQWQSSRLMVALPTEMGTIELTTSHELQPAEWTPVKVNIQRRSISVMTGGAAVVNDRIGLGHMHSTKMDFGFLMDEMVTGLATSELRNVAITCTTVADSNVFNGADMGAINGETEKISTLYTKTSLVECRHEGPNEFKVNTVRMTSLNGSSDPYMVVHLMDAPVGEVFNIRVKLRSKSSSNGFKYIIPTVALKAIKPPAYPFDKRQHNLINFDEVELAGYLGKNHLIPAASDYHMRVEVLRQIPKEPKPGPQPTPQPSVFGELPPLPDAGGPSDRKTEVVACVRIRNLVVNQAPSG